MGDISSFACFIFLFFIKKSVGAFTLILLFLHYKKCDIGAFILSL